MDDPALSPTVPPSRGLVSGERVFRRFMLVRLLGRGGMGVVWLARDETLAAEVALKFLSDAVRWDAAALAALRQETRRSQVLTHPHIVRVHDIHEDAGAAAIAMEYLPGGSLHQLRAARTPPVLTCPELATWLQGLCAALDHAHAQQVVHRDLKPANLLLSANHAAKVADFGIAQPLFETALRVSQWAPSGTLAYMSPQQHFGEPVSPADDIYALGATLYELLTGKPPFYVGNIAAQVERRQPDTIIARRRQLGIDGEPVPRAWEEAIAACLAKRPEDRPTSAGEVARRLTATTTKPARSFVTYYVTNPLRRFRPRPLLLGALALTLGAAAWFYLPWMANDAAPHAAAPFASDATRALAAWNFDGDGRDASGHGLDLAGSRIVPTADRHGRIDRALHFNGNSSLSHENFPVAGWSGMQPYTVSLWVRAQSTGGQSSTLINLMPARQGDHYWSLILNEGRPLFIDGRQQVDNPDEVMGNARLPADQWNHLTAVNDGRQLRLYVNGRPAGTKPVMAARDAAPPTHATLSVGHAHRLDPQKFSGDLDDLRLWRRALDASEVGALAALDAPPVFALTRGTYSEREDLAAVAVREFGPGATLADWDDLRRWHADDTTAFADEVGFLVNHGTVYVQRSGRRISEVPRHYFVDRFDGKKPDYYLVHDELGGMTLVLGSWYGSHIPALITRPFSAPLRTPVPASADGSLVRAFAPGEMAGVVAIHWEKEIVRNPTGTAVRAELRLRGGRTLLAEYTPSSDGNFSLSLGDAAKPQLTRQAGASYDTLAFTLVARANQLHFRAVSVRGAEPLFMESVTLPDLDLAELAELRLSGVDAAVLKVEK